MFDPKELKNIMDKYDIDEEAAYYYMKFGILPDAILINRLTKYIEDYVVNPNCRTPMGFSYQLIDLIQLSIDQYPKIVNLDDLVIPTCVLDTLKKELTPARLESYQKVRPSNKMEVLMFRKKHRKILEEKLLNKAFNIDELLLSMDSLISKNNPNTVIGTFEAMYDVLSKNDSISFTMEDIGKLKEYLKKYEGIVKESDYYHLETLISILKSPIQFKDINTMLDSRIKNYQDRLDTAPFRDSIDGVSFSSNSRAGLEKLKSFYRSFQLDSNTIYNQFFLKTMSDKKLTLTNIEPPNSFLSNSDGPCFVANTNAVYLDDDALKGYYSTEVLYHEGQHFLNSTIDDDMKKRIETVIEALRFAVDKNDTSSQFLKDYEDEYYHWYQFFNSFKEEGVEALEDYIIKKHGMISDKLIDMEWDKYCKNMVYGHLFQNGYNAIADIFDAIFKGKYSTTHKLLGSGHGSQFENDSNCCEEVMSEISLLYNNGNIDLLLQYLPYSDVLELIHIYEEIIGMNTKNDELLSDKNDIKNRIDHSSVEDISNYTYAIASHYLEQAMQEYGEKEFVDLLIEYQMTGDLDLFKDEKVRKYISYLDNSHISMFLQGNLTVELNTVYNTLKDIMKEYDIGDFYHLLASYIYTGDINIFLNERLRECISLLSIGQVNFFMQNYVLGEYLEARSNSLNR